MTDPFHEGYVAAREGKSAFDNPYDLSIDLDHNCDWHDGYIDALNDIHSERERREYWADVRASWRDALINILWAVGFIIVCWAIGFGIRYLVNV